MAMISIKRYLDFPPSETYQRMLALVAEAVTSTPLGLDLQECERFQNEVAEIQSRFTSEAEIDDLFVTAGAIGQAVERHHHAVGGMIRNQNTELQNMIDMLSQTLQALGSASETSAQNLEAIAEQLKRASALGDIRDLRQRLAECLKRVREEAGRQKRDSEEKMHVLREGLAASHHQLSAGGMESEVDRVTGFAGRGAAEVAIQQVAGLEGTHYIAVAVLSRLQAVNLRFGYAIGDEVLCEFAARFAAGLGNSAQFYRWRGPTILAILKRTEPAHMLQAELGRVLERPVMKSLSGGSQNAFITLSATGVMIPVAPPASDLIQRIDGFIASQIPNDYKS